MTRLHGGKYTHTTSIANSPSVGSACRSTHAKISANVRAVGITRAYAGRWCGSATAEEAEEEEAKVPAAAVAAADAEEADAAEAETEEAETAEAELASEAEPEAVEAEAGPASEDMVSAVSDVPDGDKDDTAELDFERDGLEFAE